MNMPGIENFLAPSPKERDAKSSNLFNVVRR
jgi:hypothetical protein